MRRAETIAIVCCSALFALSAPAACVPPFRMCAAAIDCGPLSSCVAGRCVTHGAAPAIVGARRILYDPVAVGYVQRGRPSSANVTSTVAVLGRGDGALILLRFALPLPPEVEVIEAYVVIDRVLAIDADPVPIALHAARVVDRWDARSLSWPLQPRIAEVGAPVTRVLPGVVDQVRLDVRSLVERWRRRGSGEDGGLAIVADGANPSGVAFALAPQQRLPWAEPLQSRSEEKAATHAPRLELYLR